MDRSDRPLTASRTGRPSTRILTGRWRVLGGVGAAGIALGLLSAASGQLVTVPVDSCGVTGRTGAPLGWVLWWGSVVATLVTTAATAFAFAGAVLPRYRHLWQVGALLLGWTMGAGAAALLAIASNIGDAPLFCF